MHDRAQLNSVFQANVLGIGIDIFYGFLYRAKIDTPLLGALKHDQKKKLKCLLKYKAKFS